MKYCVNKKRGLDPAKQKKRQALWFETAGRCIVLRGRNNFFMSTGVYKTKSRANQQAKRLARRTGFELRKVKP